MVGLKVVFLTFMVLIAPKVVKIKSMFKIEVQNAMS